MKIISIDTETTGLDVDTCEIIELGYALYDTDCGLSPIAVYDELALPKEPLVEEVRDATGLTDAILAKYAKQIDEVMLNFVNIHNQFEPDFIVGHNIIDYDRPVMIRHLELILGAELSKKVPIIDTRIDLPFKRTPKNNNLAFLAAEYGEFVNPFPHRAIFDAVTTAKLMFKIGSEKAAANALSPLIELKADCNFNTKDLAKAAGYNWDGDRKIWFKKIRESVANETERNRPFQVFVENRFGIPTL